MKPDKFKKVLALARKAEGNERKTAWTRVAEAYRKYDPIALYNLDDFILPSEWADILYEKYVDGVATASGKLPDCRTCLYVDMESQICRRKAPTALVAREEVHQGFPNIFPGADWCGEWLGLEPGVGLED